MIASPLTLNVGSRIAIVDDDSDAVQIANIELVEAGFEPILIDPLALPNDYARLIASKAQGALCDHRLSWSGYARFSGAELVAFLYDLHIPAILVTQYIDIDKDVSIRKWRKKIPILLSRDETNSEAIKAGLNLCGIELKGNLSNGRKPHRTLIRVANCTSESGEDVVDSIIPAWNPNRAVRFPMSLISEDMRAKVKPGRRLFAQINIGAEKSEDLYLDNFELAPELDNDELA